MKDKWGCRSLEPNKCVVSSLLLVRLKTNPPPGETPPDSPSLDPVTSQSSTTTGGGGGNGRSRSRSRIAQLASSASRAALRSLSSKEINPIIVLKRNYYYFGGNQQENVGGLMIGLL